MFELTNPVRDYAWGSRRRLARFLGREPSGGPEAELWIGAHAGDPSVLPDGRRLDEAISADPVGLLGERVHAAHGARLPFLMKVLAVGEPLSLQVHPSSERALWGFDLEQRAGIPVDAPDRNYRDPWHKPELIYALTRFEGMAGFRDTVRTAALLRALAHPWADRTATRLGDGSPGPALRAAVVDILAMSPSEAASTIAQLADAADRVAERSHGEERAAVTVRSRRDSEEAVVRREVIRVCELFPQLAERYPDDPGVLVTLLLNHVVLAPGEAMFVGAGVIHAYVSGFGVEIMAASDNVLRAGLTPKHRDVDEVIEATVFEPTGAPLEVPTEEGATRQYRPGVGDFEMTVTSGADHRLCGDGPSLVLALDPDVSLTESGGRVVLLDRGQVAFMPAGTVADVRGRTAIGGVPLHVTS